MSRDRELMRFYDGELSSAEAREVERRLGRDGEARDKLRGLAQTSELVRGWAEERSAGFDIADSVMQRVAPAARRRSRLVELWLPATAAVALAAAVSLVVFTRSAPVELPAPSARLAPLPAPGASLAQVLPEAPRREPEVAIESVDFGEQPGTIFMVGGEKGETPVIWLTDPAPTRMHL